MRPWLSFVLFLSSLVAFSVAGEPTFPFRAHVRSGVVCLRSGPGEGYYCTARLAPASVVEVYREEPGGWLAVRPPEGSFSWISCRYVKVTAQGLGEVIADRIPSCVGSELSDARDVIHVYLRIGEVVEILGTKQTGAGASATTWYKIAPPAGEFRWIAAKDLQPNIPAPVAASSPIVTAEMKTEEPATNLAADDQAEEPTRREVKSAVEPSGPAVLQRGPAAPTQPTTAGNDNELGYQATLDQINGELSAMLAQDPATWNCDGLARRTEALLLRAQTAVQRGHARLLLNRITQAMELRERQLAANDVRAEADRDSRQMQQLDLARQRLRADAAQSTRFDGVGRLQRVQPGKLGTPRYALVDADGAVRYYVSPAPGVKMQHHVGHRIGVMGIREPLEGDAPLITAKRITVLDNPQLR